MSRALTIGARSRALEGEAVLRCHSKGCFDATRSAGFVPFVDEDGSDLECLMTIRPWFEQLNEEADQEGGSSDTPVSVREPLSCTAVDWNAAGTVLMAAFGRLTSSGLDATTAGVGVFSVFARDFDPSKESHCPSRLLKTTTSLVSLSCHPKNPALVAAGGVSGEVLVWDVEGGLVGSSPISDLSHQHPVRGLAWFQPVGSEVHLLVSGCEGGKLLVWDPLGVGMSGPIGGVSMRPSRVKTVFRVELDDDGEGAAASRKSRHSRSEKYADGVVGVSVLPDGSAAVVSLQSGAVNLVGTPPLVQAFFRDRSIPTHRAPSSRGQWDSMAAPSQPPGASIPWTVAAAALANGNSEIVKNTERYAKEMAVSTVRVGHVLLGHHDVLALYPAAGGIGSGVSCTELQPHSSSATCVSASPLVRGLVLSGAVDGTAVVRSALLREPVAQSTPGVGSTSAVSCAAWSFARPLVYACGMNDGTVAVVNGERSLVAPAVTLDPAGSLDPSLGRLASPPPRMLQVDNEALFQSLSRVGLWNPLYSPAVCALAFSRSQRRVLATGNAAGYVQVWRLPQVCAMVVSSEENAARKLVRGGAEAPPSSSSEAN
jgi:WD40 repeat protein